MKHILYILFGFILFTSCIDECDRNKPTYEMSDTEYVRYKVTTDDGNTYTTTLSVRKFKYEGHSYILVHYNGECGLEHDQNCECFKTK